MSQESGNKPGAELERLERAYRAITPEEPPDLLDQAVLNRARRAVAGGSGRRPWSFGWVHGLTSAAIVVLAIALFTHQPNLPDPEPVRVANPPSAKLRDIESEIEPLRIPARDSTPQGAPPALARQLPPVADADEDQRADRGAERRRETSALAQEPLAESPGVASEADITRLQTDPDAWLAHILMLKREGQDQAAARELQAFREAWPDYALPPELDD